MVSVETAANTRKVTRSARRGAALIAAAASTCLITKAVFLLLTERYDVFYSVRKVKNHYSFTVYFS
jgi:hypothetical protein